MPTQQEIDEARANYAAMQGDLFKSLMPLCFKSTATYLSILDPRDIFDESAEKQIKKAIRFVRFVESHEESLASVFRGPPYVNADGQVVCDEAKPSP